MKYVTLCIANDEDFEATLGIHAFDGDLSRGIDQITTYKEGMQEILNQYPNCRAVASVLRDIHSVEDGDWMGIYLKDGVFYETPISYCTQSGSRWSRRCFRWGTASWSGKKVPASETD